MSEDVYAIPDLTKKVRYGRRERQQEMEERGEREEMEVDIYDSADDIDLGPDPGPGTQQNITQDQHAASDESKKNNGFRAATVGLGLLCVILLAVITGLGINKNKGCNELCSSNLTEQKDLLQSSFDQLKSRYNELMERDDIKKILCESQYGFTFADGVCYYISTEKKTWEQSRQYCKGKQSDLMTIKTKEKQDFVYSILQSDQHVWLGLTDRVEERTFKWVDETPLQTTPTYWNTGEPNDRNNEDCVVFIKPFSVSTKSWDDRACSSNMYRWICERVP